MNVSDIPIFRKKLKTFPPRNKPINDVVIIPEMKQPPLPKKPKKGGKTIELPRQVETLYEVKEPIQSPIPIGRPVEGFPPKGGVLNYHKQLLSIKGSEIQSSPNITQIEPIQRIPLIKEQDPFEGKYNMAFISNFLK